MRRKRFATTGALVLGTSAIALVSVFGASPAVSATTPGCTPATNIAVILDDSGSMSGTDPNRLRVSGVKVLLALPGNAKKTMSALEFGSDAAAIFNPALIGAQKGPMGAALDAAIQADNGSTNYNAAFDLRKTQNPNANRIIFLTDGGHNSGDYLNGHVGGPPVDVVGFGTSTTGTDGARLQQIATDTKGTYHPQIDANNLQKVMAEIDAIENCITPPETFVDPIDQLTDVVRHTVKVTGSTKYVDFVLSWAAGTDAFDASGFTITQNGHKVAISKRKKPRKLKITRTVGTTFETIRLKRVKRGKLKFKLKATKLTTPGVPVSLTTQLTQSSR